MIEIKEDENYKFLKITDKGKRLLLKYELEGLVQDKPKNGIKIQSGYFRYIRTKKKTRDHLRVMLRSFGFICLQNSVWVYPYECQEIIDLLKQYLELKEEALYMTVESIENDKWLKKSLNYKLYTFLRS